MTIKNLRIEFIEKILEGKEKGISFSDHEALVAFINSGNMTLLETKSKLRMHTYSWQVMTDFWLY